MGRNSRLLNTPAFSQHRQRNSRISNFIARRLQSTAVKELGQYISTATCMYSGITSHQFNFGVCFCLIDYDS